MSVHGLAYDSLTRTLAFIGLDDEGMSIGAIDPESGAIRTLLKPSYVSIYNLRAGAGLLSFNSIQSGKDEIHLYDLRAGRQYRLSRSRYGSLSPSAPEADSLYYSRLIRSTATGSRPSGLRPVRSSRSSIRSFRSTGSIRRDANGT